MDVPMDAVARRSVDFMGPGTADHLTQELAEERAKIQELINGVDATHEQAEAEYRQHRDDLLRRLAMCDAALEIDAARQAKAMPVPSHI